MTGRINQVSIVKRSYLLLWEFLYSIKTTREILYRKWSLFNRVNEPNFWYRYQRWKFVGISFAKTKQQWQDCLLRCSSSHSSLGIPNCSLWTSPKLIRIGSQVRGWVNNITSQLSQIQLSVHSCVNKDSKLLHFYYFDTGLCKYVINHILPRR